jgi:glycosyltransferase involved in cell wall biosynthesis
MRISILTHGENLFGRHYVRAFLERGHEVAFLSLTPCDAGVPGVATRVVGPAGFVPNRDPSRAAYLKTVLPVRRAVRELRPDILFALYMSSAGVAACMSGHPHVVVSARGSDVMAHVSSALWRSVFRWEGRRAALVHAVSAPLAEVLERRVGVAAEKLLVCPIGVDTERLALVDPAARPAAGRILCTRAHKPVYDHATLVRAMGRLKGRGTGCHVTFANAYLAETTRDLVRDAGVEGMATFLPGYRIEDLPALMAGADVYVSCSLSDGTSSSLLEAMSTGTFPVVSDIPANRPWVEHGRSGYLFPPGDDAALADRLAEALADAGLRARAAPVCRDVVVRGGDVRRQMDTLLAAFERCLNT